MTYTFEYIFIPKIVDNSNQSDFTLDSSILFDSFDSLQIAFSEHHPHQAQHFDWPHFSIRKEMRSDVEYWLFSFPAPQTEPEARWGIVVHREGNPYQYYTFEMSAKGKYAFCQMREGLHLNYGFFPQDLPLEEFIQLALRHSAPSAVPNFLR